MYLIIEVFISSLLILQLIHNENNCDHNQHLKSGFFKQIEFFFITKKQSSLLPSGFLVLVFIVLQKKIFFKLLCLLETSLFFFFFRYQLLAQNFCLRALILELNNNSLSIQHFPKNYHFGEFVWRQMGQILLLSF